MVKWSKLVNYKYVPRLRNVGFGVTGVIRIVVEILVSVALKLFLAVAKLDHSSRTHSVAVFSVFRTWLRQQFEELKFGTEADNLAMHVLTLSQGVATLSNAFHDIDFVHREVECLNNWLTWRVGAGRSSQGRC